MSDDHNLRLEIRNRQIRKIADHVQDMVLAHGEDGCWLAVPRDFSHQLLDEIPEHVSEQIEKIVPHNLVKANEQKLLERFDDMSVPLLRNPRLPRNYNQLSK